MAYFFAESHPKQALWNVVVRYFPKFTKKNAISIKLVIDCIIFLVKFALTIFDNYIFK